MTVKVAAFEGQTDGTVLTAGSSGNSDDNGDDQVAVGLYSVAGGNLVYSTEQDHTGLASLKVTNTSNATVLFGYTSSPADASTFRVRFYIYIATMPSATIRPFVLASSAGSTLARLQLTSAGVLSLIATGTSTAGTALSTGQWYRVELQGSGLNSAAGVFDCQVYSGPDDTGTPFATMGLTAQTTAALGSQHRFGITVAPGAATGVVMYYDDLASEFGSSTPFGPTASSTTPIVGVDSSTFSETVTLVAASVAGSVDATAFTEASVLAITSGSSVADSATQAEGTSVLTVGISVTDGWILSEASSETAADTGVDDQSMTEVSNLQQAASLVDSATQTDASSIAVTSSLTDSATQSEGLTGLSVSLAVVDTNTFSDSSSVFSGSNLTAADSWTVSETSTLVVSLSVNDSNVFTDTTTSSLSSVTASDQASQTDATTNQSSDSNANDSATQSDATGTVTQGPNTSDLWSLAENVSLSIDGTALDSAVQSDFSAILVSIVVTDGASQAEGASTIAQEFNVVDSTSMSDFISSSLSSNVASDSAAETDLSTLNAGGDIQATDISAASEGVSAIAGVFADLSDMQNATESSAMLASTPVSDSWAMSESSGLLISMQVNDSIIHSDSATLFSGQDPVGSDSATQTESAAIAILTSISVSDDAVQNEIPVVIVVAAIADDPAILFENPLITATTTAFDSFAGLESAVLGALFGVQGYDSATQAEQGQLEIENIDETGFARIKITHRSFAPLPRVSYGPGGVQIVTAGSPLQTVVLRLFRDADQGFKIDWFRDSAQTIPMTELNGKQMKIQIGSDPVKEFTTTCVLNRSTFPLNETDTDLIFDLYDGAVVGEDGPLLNLRIEVGPS